MAVILDIDKTHDATELIARYNLWRRIYGYAGKAAPDEPYREGGRLHFRVGYPHPEWSANVIECGADGLYRVLHVSTERRDSPIESATGIFSRLEDAGKFIIFKAATSLMISCFMDPLTWKWEDAGLDPRVDAQVQSDQVVKYVLRNNPLAYFVMTRGDMPYSHILPLSYDELDAELLDGFPEGVVSRLSSESP
jgi:hypothetical protein